MTHLLCVYNGFLSGFHGSSTNRLLLELPTNTRFSWLSHYCLEAAFAILIKN